MPARGCETERAFAYTKSPKSWEKADGSARDADLWGVFKFQLHLSSHHFFKKKKKKKIKKTS
jgi:hypothetical protein